MVAIPPYLFRILEYRVVDGDSIRCVVDLGFHMRGDVDVRLKGIDAPEARGDRTRECGKAVAAVVQKWLDDRRAGGLVLVSDGLDKYGRSLGSICESVTASATAQEFLRKPTLVQFLVQNILVHRYDGTGERGFTDEELVEITARANALLEERP